MASPSDNITLADKLAIIPVLSRAIASALYRLMTRPFLSGPKANTVFKDAAFAALRTQLGLLSVPTEQWLNPSTESNYLSFAQKQGFQPDTTVLDSGLKLHWLGTKNAEKIILYFHGGGYVLSCSAGHFQWLFDLQNELAKDRSVSAVLVGYTLAPHGQYPTQLKQAAESLAWFIEDQRKKPSDVSSCTPALQGLPPGRY